MKSDGTIIDVGLTADNDVSLTIHSPNSLVTLTCSKAGAIDLADRITKIASLIPDKKKVVPPPNNVCRDCGGALIFKDVSSMARICSNCGLDHTEPKED